MNQANTSSTPINKNLEATTTDATTGLQRKLTFAENEILESFPSENSGSDFSIDDNSQNNTIINADDNDYLTASITYETPITTVETLTAESSKNEDDQKQRRIKLNRSNDDFDDYELQEKLSNSPNNRPNDIMKHQHDEHNESTSHM